MHRDNTRAQRPAGADGRAVRAAASRLPPRTAPGAREHPRRRGAGRAARAGTRAAGCDDGVGRKEERVAVVRGDRAGGALRGRMSGGVRELAVGDGLAVRHSAQCASNGALKRARSIEVEIDPLEADALAGEVPLKHVDETFRNRRSPVTDASPFSRYRRSQREAGVNPTRVGGGGPRSRPVGTWPRELVPDEACPFEPELALAPALRRVG